MATVGTQLAKNMKLYFGATAITCQVDASMSGQTNMFETTCKDSASEAAFLPGTTSWTMSGTLNYAHDATLGFNTSTTGIFDKWQDGASVSAVFQTAVTGDTKWSGSGYISSWNMNSSGNDEAVTVDFEIQGTGTLTMATVS